MTLLNSNKMDYLETADTLFSSILNILNGKAILSCAINNGSLDCKICVSDKFPAVTLMYTKQENSFEKSFASFKHFVSPIPNAEDIVQHSFSSQSSVSDFACKSRLIAENKEHAIMPLHIVNESELNAREYIANKSKNMYSPTSLHAQQIVKIRSPSKMEVLNNESSSEINEDEKSKDENFFTCSYCGKIFLYRCHKNSHERIHTGVKPFKCCYCDKSFTSRSNERTHERSHTGERPYSCSYCDKTFFCNSNKLDHERSHTGEKPFGCRYCDKSFSSSSSRIRHERVHTGEKPYHCIYCNKTFPSGSSKAKHERSHIREDLLL